MFFIIDSTNGIPAIIVLQIFFLLVLVVGLVLTIRDYRETKKEYHHSINKKDVDHKSGENRG